MIELTPIGVVASPVTEPVDTDWGTVTARIQLDEQAAGGLEGLASFSHAIVVTWLDRAQFVRERHLVRRPQGRDDMPAVGIFSQRAKNRPNPIGITAVEIVTVEDCVLTVRGLDAIDGTPVLDLKPYYPAYDRIEDPRVPEWVPRLMTHYF